MAIKTTQNERLIQLSTPLEKDFLMIERLRCSEGMNQLFRIEVDILHEEQFDGHEPTAVDPQKLLGNPMIVSAHRPGPTTRYFNGICISFQQGSRNQRFSSYRAVLAPKVWTLTQVSRSRIFQNKTVPQILDEVLESFDVDNEIQTDGFEPRNYCVQYRESDWDFISRLMEEEGIYYYFEHTKDNHRLILGNTPSSHRVTPTAEKITYAIERSELKDDWIPSIYEWNFVDNMFTGKRELRDYHFQLPTNNLQAVQTSVFDIGKNKDLEVYDFPGEYAKRFDGIDPGGDENSSRLDPIFQDRERTVRIRQEGIDVSYKRGNGISDSPAITPGYRFSFIDHPNKKYNMDFVAVTATHEAVQTPTYISGDPVDDPYVVMFTCIPHGSGQAPFRPERRTRKPIVHGSQTAVVVGNPGDEIFTDKYGRVKVHFHWDRSDHNDQRASAWIRVGTMIAGNKWGTMFIPRVGQEVLVDFLEGDPDQPIIVGSVYNEKNLPHYELDKYKTLSYIKTHSTPKAKGFNELRFEDKAKKEQVFIHSQKRYDLRARGSMYETCGGNRHEVIGWNVTDGDEQDHGGNLAVTVGGNHDLHVVGEQFIGIDKALYETVKSDVGEEYKGQLSTKVTAKGELNARSITLEALSSITLKVGASFIVVDLTGITIQGPMVKINSGGAATGTSPFLMADPMDATSADTGEPGYLDRPRTGGGGGGRRWRVVDGYHAPVVRRNDDGSYQVQSVVVRGTPEYQQAVLTDLAQMSNTNEGQALLDRLEATGQTTTINQMNPAPNPPNAFAAPGNSTDADFQAATAAGQPVFDGAGNPINDASGNQLLGTGTGGPSNVSYNPDQWPDPTSDHNAPGDVILFHELQHSEHQQNGTYDGTPRADGFTTNEEFNTIGPENRYRDERGVERRTNHGDL
ncbi:MAG TPA: type VI secretion system tip protein TssI/VgrG [Pyrinomonadaceae bacterium]|nr:type VI secretion system tip protein TssI/VgrG [Pyrinomonadaceae bacterium]